MGRWRERRHLAGAAGWGSAGQCPHCWWSSFAKSRKRAIAPPRQAELYPVPLPHPEAGEKGKTGPWGRPPEAAGPGGVERVGPLCTSSPGRRGRAPHAASPAATPLPHCSHASAPPGHSRPPLPPLALVTYDSRNGPQHLKTTRIKPVSRHLCLRVLSLPGHALLLPRPRVQSLQQQPEHVLTAPRPQGGVPTFTCTHPETQAVCEGQDGAVCTAL